MKKGHLSSDKPISVEMTTQDLAEIIDSVVQAVDKTQFGPLVEYGGTPEKPQKIISQVAFPIFIQTLNIVLSKVDVITLIPERDCDSGIITSLSQI